MNRVLSLFALLLLLLMLAGLAMVWWMPAATPAVLAPLATWLQRTVGNEEGSSTRPATPAASSAAASVYGRKGTDASTTAPAVPGGTAANVVTGPAPIDLAGRGRVASVEVDAQGNARVRPPDPARADATEAIAGSDDPDAPPIFDPEAIPTEPSGGQIMIADATPAAESASATSSAAQAGDRTQAVAERSDPPGPKADAAPSVPVSAPTSPAAAVVRTPALAAAPVPAAAVPRASAAAVPQSSAAGVTEAPVAAPRSPMPALTQPPVAIDQSPAATVSRTTMAAAGIERASRPLEGSPTANKAEVAAAPLRMPPTVAASQPPASGASSMSAAAVPLGSATAGLPATDQRPPDALQQQAAAATERLVAREAPVAMAPVVPLEPMVPRVLGRIESSEPADAGSAPLPNLTGTASPASAGLDEAISAANRARLASLMPPDAPAPPPASSIAGRRQDASIRSFLDGKVVEFVIGRDQLSERGKRALDALVPLIQGNRETQIIIQGHTDSVGDDASNLALSGARALVARDYLIARGVDPTRLKAQALGERRPIASNRTAEGRVRNRRIDFVVTERDGGR